MHGRTRTLKFTAVLTFVVLSLTGFSTGRHHSRHGGHGSGGGCSSSRQDQDSSSSSTSGAGSYGDPDDDSYGSSSTNGGSGGSTYGRRPTHRAGPTPSGGTAKALRDGRATLVGCASGKKPYATVEITNPNDRKSGFSTDVSFRNRDDDEIESGHAYVTVPAHGRATARVEVPSGSTALIDHCKVRPAARPE